MPARIGYLCEARRCSEGEGIRGSRVEGSTNVGEGVGLNMKAPDNQDSFRFPCTKVNTSLMLPRESIRH